MPPLLAVNDLHKGFATGSGVRLKVLRGVSFSIERGEVVAVTGESGTGKSTLLHLLGALDRPDLGAIVYDGVDLAEQSDAELSRFRNTSLGFVFQFHHLLPEFTALENVAMPALISGQRMVSAKERAMVLLEQLGLSRRLCHRPAELSGGEQQRVAVARALMNHPDLILADEPTGSLDTKTAHVLHDEIIRLSREYDQAFVIATHNTALSEMCDRVLLLRSGRIA